MKRIFFLLLLGMIVSCKSEPKQEKVQKEEVVHQRDSLDKIATKQFRDFKVTDAKVIQNKTIWAAFEEDFKKFTEVEYQKLRPVLLEREISEIHRLLNDGTLSYEELVLFYLYRIRKYDRENDTSLNSVIAINPDVVKQARLLDEKEHEMVSENSMYGIPVLVKDNVNTSKMSTTAGAIAMMNNKTEDAFVITKLKERGALILGKANLSEWAYFFCGDCPSGYSAVGGQTFNPYGRKKFDTGGSSSGSGVAVAANFCAVAIGTETAGSILSPASQNAVVGLKPTIGLISRGGIVPISSTLDTPGPMGRKVKDVAIMLTAMVGEDQEDPATLLGGKRKQKTYYEGFDTASVKGKRFGVLKSLVEDSLYQNATKVIEELGGTLVVVEEEKVELPGFLRLLNLDMKKDLEVYLSIYGGKDVKIKNVEDVILFNEKDTLIRAPYGQALLKGVVADSASTEELLSIKEKLKTEGRKFFDVLMDANQLDVVLSVNNYHAGFAAVAEYPALTVPMGVTEEGEPKGLTFIGKPFAEKKLLECGYVYEQQSKSRKQPKAYQ
ncbi:amidase family protein [Aquimarina hainanensis]|uniref:Amidase family protein n=1 Tax=Aquimarina hainanensis TaxID=1578017 RepID=A0ABW5N6T7_9FLAO